MNLPKVFAHRGGRAWAPENTMAAFARSLEAGVDGIELDIQRCASGELVVFHDHELNRTTNGAGLIKNCSLDELMRLSAGSWFDREFKSEKIPTLTEVLSMIDGQVVVNIEIKNAPVDYPGIEDDVIDLLSDYEHMDKIIFSSFDNRLVKRMQAKRPDWQFAVLMDGIPPDLPCLARSMGATFWHPHYHSILPDAVEEAQEHGIAINTWTVNDERDWVDLIKMGVGGIITDDPLALINFLRVVVKVRG